MNKIILKFDTDEKGNPKLSAEVAHEMTQYLSKALKCEIVGVWGADLFEIDDGEVSKVKQVDQLTVEELLKRIE